MTNTLFLVVTLSVLGVAHGSLTAMPEKSSQITKDGTIDLGFGPAGQPQDSIGQGEMYYTVQKNQTLVAVNLTSKAVVYRLDLKPLCPSGSGYDCRSNGNGDLAASKSGYFAINLDSALRTRIIDPQGKPTGVLNTRIYSGYSRLQGSDSIVCTDSGRTRLLSSNFKTGQQTVLLETKNQFSVRFPEKEAEAPTVVVTEGVPSGVQRVFEYNYETNATIWELTDLQGDRFVESLYHGQDANYIFVLNGSVSNFAGQKLLVYSKATVKQVLNLGPYYFGGQYDQVRPVVQGGLLNFVYPGANPRNLDVVNISTGVTVSHQELPKACNDYFTTDGQYFVCWGRSGGKYNYHLITYPGGNETVNKDTGAQAPIGGFPLPGSDLVMDVSFVSSTGVGKIQVWNFKTLALVYTEPQYNSGLYAPYVNAEKQLVAVTNGTACDVFHFSGNRR